MKIVVFVMWFGLAAAKFAKFPDFFENFSQNLLVRHINNQQRLWTAGRNFSPGTTLSELMDLLGVEMSLSTWFLVQKTSDPVWPADEDIPEFFDARETWHNCTVISDVLDQSQCGSCWVMSPAQVATDRYCIASNGRHDIRLSDQEILACEKFHFLKGCMGGNPADAYRFILRHGLVSGGAFDTNMGCQPYSMPKCCHHGAEGPYRPCGAINRTIDNEICNLTCTNNEYKPKFYDDIRRFSRIYKLGSNEKYIQKDIMTYGPVSTQFNLHQDFFFYKSGVYEPVLPLVISRNGQPTGHTLKLFGWGKENGVPYWLGMNTWNEYWGDQGTIKIKRRSPTLQLESLAFGVIPKIDPKFYGDEYQCHYRR